MGCLSMIAMVILLALCPPLIIVFVLLYSFYETHEEDINYIFNMIIVFLFAVVLIISPIITILSLITDYQGNIKDFWFGFLITAIDIVVAIVYIIYKFLNKKSTEHKEKETIIEKETECSNQPEETKPKVSLEKLPINTIDNTIVYITPQGKKYHHYECQCIKGRNDLIKTTISESKGKGCEPCGVCFRNKK